MPCLVPKKCPVCGDPHQFWLRADMPTEGASYEFTCPKEGIRATVAFPLDGDWGQTIHGAQPPGSVEARKV